MTAKWCIQFDQGVNGGTPNWKSMTIYADTEEEALEEFNGMGLYHRNLFVELRAICRNRDEALRDGFHLVDESETA